MRRTFGGPAKGKGAAYQWDGENPFGMGRAQIAEADSPTRLVVDLDLTRPVEGRLKLNFSLERNGTATTIAVSTSGPDEAVKYAMDAFFGDNLIPLSCAAGGSPKNFCDIMMKMMTPSSTKQNHP